MLIWGNYSTSPITYTNIIWHLYFVNMLVKLNVISSFIFHLHHFQVFLFNIFLIFSTDISIAALGNESNEDNSIRLYLQTWLKLYFHPEWNYKILTEWIQIVQKHKWILIRNSCKIFNKNIKLLSLNRSLF